MGTKCVLKVSRQCGFWVLVLLIPWQVNAADRFSPMDVFQLEVAQDPQISPAGDQIVYVRGFMDIMTDSAGTNLWLVNADGSDHQPLTSGSGSNRQPRWSPDGTRLAYIATKEGSTQLHVRWMATGREARITNLIKPPNNIVWSPDGTQIALTIRVSEESKPLITMPKKPKNAKWAEPAKVIDRLIYRSDGQGFLEPAFSHLFIVPADGGTPRQLTSGPFDHSTRPVWLQDGSALIISANRHDDSELEPANSELYLVTLSDDSVTPLTSRSGPDSAPVLSPNGEEIAYLGYEDQYKGYQIADLTIADKDGSGIRVISEEFDHGMSSPIWSGDGRKIYFAYIDHGKGKVATMSMKGQVIDLIDNMGGVGLSRPYTSGSYSVSDNGVIAYSGSDGTMPSDVWLRSKRGKISRLTKLNDDLIGNRSMARVEEVSWRSSFDQRAIQGWLVTPPDFEEGKKYPFILEIHGGPFAAYGPHFSAEIQLYAAAGYVVLYCNPRGSSSYGADFGNLIDQNYPGEDYDDLISGVDSIIARGLADPEKLFVTGGSGGGVLSAWIIGKTDRFKAAVVAKPVINWISFALTADMYNFFYRYWLPGLPWDHFETYWKRSPLSLVGNVKTPTMLLTGESDYRTPISETEQYYQALKLQNIDATMVRIPNSSHGIASRPSNLISKVKHVLAWFDKYGGETEPEPVD